MAAADAIVLERVDALARRFELTEIELAVLAGIAIGTLRWARAARRLPRRPRPRARLLAFVERARRAGSRAELRLPEVQP